MKWKPIETAPKDGSLVVVWWEDRPTVVRWLGKQKPGWYDDSEQPVTAAYWMPISAPRVP